MASRDPITCHVLDTTAGRPAVGISSTLTCLDNPAVLFTATTNTDGRIATWRREKGDASIEALILQHAGSAGGRSSVWRIGFDTEAYFGAGNTFFPVVELTFVVKPGEHFHVPLLLGPYSYTTYRGS